MVEKTSQDISLPISRTNFDDFLEHYKAGLRLAGNSDEVTWTGPRELALAVATEIAKGAE